MDKMDKKFYGEIRKVKNDQIVPEDEWICFLVKDNAFALTLPTYLENCIKLGADEEQIRLVKELIARADHWRTGFADRCKVPDAVGEKVLQ